MLELTWFFVSFFMERAYQEAEHSYVHRDASYQGTGGGGGFTNGGYSDPKCYWTDPAFGGPKWVCR